MDTEHTGDGEEADVTAADDVSGAVAPERKTMRLEQKVSGGSDGIGSLVVGVPEDRVTVDDVEGHEIEVRRWEPSGRTDLDETEVIVHDLYAGEAVVLTLEVSENG